MMTPSRSLFTALAVVLLAVPAVGAPPGDRLFELRTYHANEGKLDALHARFREHTCALFEEHGIRSVAYWVPVENQENVLIYLVSYPDRKAREASWQAFFDDPKWKAAYNESVKDGKLVGKVTRRFLEPTDYSPTVRISAAKPPRLFEMRTYTTEKNRLGALNARFREHTCRLFERHGMTNLLYTMPADDEEGAGTTLLYFLAHRDGEARDKSFEAFREDPAWIAARKDSVKDGPILVENGVKSVLLMATDYSPMK